jgi:hypothetical protein
LYQNALTRLCENLNLYRVSSPGQNLQKVNQMADEQKKGKAEETAEKTGELVGKGLKKGWGVVKAVGKGTKDAVEDKKKE